MSAKPFLDTNILIYALAAGDPRTRRALALVAAGGTVSVQVLNEFASVSYRKLGRDWAEIEATLADLRTLLDPPVALTANIHDDAISLARDHAFAFWDALIVAAAAHAGCNLLFSEDMHDGLSIGGLTIRNPFL